MTMPKRIQMTRQRPWRAEHPDAVIVDRRTKWGNPFPVGLVIPQVADPLSTEDAVRLFRLVLTGGCATLDGVWFSPCWVDEHGVWRWPWPATDRARPSLDEIRAELRGRDLACWCPLDQPCHADVLLELANGRST